jgi:hypothetical protein
MEQLICERYSVGSPASGTHKAMMLFVCASRCTPFIVFHLIAKETEQEKRFFLLLPIQLSKVFENPNFIPSSPAFQSYQKKHKNLYERERAT